MGMTRCPNANLTFIDLTRNEVRSKSRGDSTGAMAGVMRFRDQGWAMMGENHYPPRSFVLGDCSELTLQPFHV